MPGTFAFPGASMDVWVPLALRPADRDSHESRWLQTIARIDRRSLAAANARIQAAMTTLGADLPKSNADWRARSVPLHGVVVAQARPTLIVLSLAIACVLLRLALLAVPSILAWRTVREAVTLVSIGAIVGFAAAIAAGQVMASLLHDVSAYDAATFAGALLILLTTAVLTAIGPARTVAGIDPSVTLRS